MPAVAAGALLFVSGHDPEAGGRLVYRGRLGRDLGRAAGRAAVRLATLNALAAAGAAAGGLDRIRRCVALTCFADAAPGALDPALAAVGRALVGRALPGRPPPLVGLRPARGLAGGMPVEVELLLELRSAGRPRMPGARRRARSAATLPGASRGRTRRLSAGQTRGVGRAGAPPSSTGAPERR